MTVPAVDGDLYFTVDGYYPGSIPSSCWQHGAAPSVAVSVYKNTADAANLVSSYTQNDYFSYPIQILSNEYSAGDKFYITVLYQWTYGIGSYPAKDYTVHVYSKQDLSILDRDGKTNMWHMDGQFPSAFANSHYRTETTTWTPTWTPRSLQDVWIVSNNVSQFLYLVWNNFWVVFWWFTVTLW